MTSFPQLRQGLPFPPEWRWSNYDQDSYQCRRGFKGSPALWHMYGLHKLVSDSVQYCHRRRHWCTSISLLHFYQRPAYTWRSARVGPDSHGLRCPGRCMWMMGLNSNDKSMETVPLKGWMILSVMPHTHSAIYHRVGGGEEFEGVSIYGDEFVPQCYNLILNNWYSISEMNTCCHRSHSSWSGGKHGMFCLIFRASINA